MKESATLAGAVRDALAGLSPCAEVAMFGGVGFMLNGNLVVAASSRGLLARVGKARQAEALGRTGARAMEMRGRPMAGYVRVDPASLGEGSLREWLELALGYVKTLPPKAKPAAAKGARKGARK